MITLVQKIRIFVASPNDVQSERNQLVDIVSELNATMGETFGFIIELVQWETHVTPDMGRPQAIINKQIGTYDIFIGIMWKHFGTPTGMANSGTEEEFQRAFELWKQSGKVRIMFYFSQAPYAPPESTAEVEQLARIVNFKKELREKGLIWNYPNQESFSKTVRPHIASVLKDLFSDASSANEPEILPDPRASQNDSDPIERERQSTVIAEFANETKYALQLAIDRPDSWELLLTEELWKSQLQPIKREYGDLRKGLVYCPTKVISGAEFMTWISESTQDLAKLIMIMCNGLPEINDAYRSSEQYGDAVEIKRAIERIISVARELLNYESTVMSLRPPPAFDDCKQLMRGLTSELFALIESTIEDFGTSLRKAKAGEAREIHVVFPMPRNVATLKAEIERLNKIRASWE